ncbi:MAG TPA: molybdenum cofactor biosysynthesis protein [Kiritimatiellia bacterium]|mgnify:CR=1 FL=1|nr:molybdenum cofactor biosysynthesis protein [Kiritimatiellia bacterium]
MNVIPRPLAIRHIYISPGHNYFGHYGGPAGGHAIQEQTECRCLAGRGIEGDRFFDHKDNYKGQVTFFSWEIFEALRKATGALDCPPSAMRRNVIVEGVELNALIEREFEMQGIRFAGTEECRPCAWMDEAVGPGAEAFLKGRGGLRARILTDGVLRVGPGELVVV